MALGSLWPALKRSDCIQNFYHPITQPGQIIYVDILPPVSAEIHIHKSHFPALLILGDAFSRFTRIIRIPNKSSQSVTSALSTFAAEHRLITRFTFWNIKKIKCDEGTGFIS
jgi:hypothetical protein